MGVRRNAMIGLSEGTASVTLPSVFLFWHCETFRLIIRFSLGCWTFQFGQAPASFTARRLLPCLHLCEADLPLWYTRAIIFAVQQTGIIHFVTFFFFFLKESDISEGTRQACQQRTGLVVGRSYVRFLAVAAEKKCLLQSLTFCANTQSVSVLTA